VNPINGECYLAITPTSRCPSAFIVTATPRTGVTWVCSLWTIANPLVTATIHIIPTFIVIIIIIIIIIILTFGAIIIIVGSDVLSFFTGKLSQTHQARETPTGWSN
jgi:hypothetical protein